MVCRCAHHSAGLMTFALVLIHVLSVESQGSVSSSRPQHLFAVIESPLTYPFFLHQLIVDREHRCYSLSSYFLCLSSEKCRLRSSSVTTKRWLHFLPFQSGGIYQPISSSLGFICMFRWGSSSSPVSSSVVGSSIAMAPCATATLEGRSPNPGVLFERRFDLNWRAYLSVDPFGQFLVLFAKPCARGDFVVGGEFK